MATIGAIVGSAAAQLRRISKRWWTVGGALAAAAVCEIGARIVTPQLNGTVLSEFIRLGQGGPLLRLYDFFVGGALSRGALLALGIMPYVSARIMVRLLRVVSPTLDALATHEAGRQRLTRLTRVVTTGLALVQSFGFARFVQSVPGAVTDPGAGFIAQTMLVLTGGSLFMMWLGERITGQFDAGAPTPVETEHHQVGERVEQREPSVQSIEQGDRAAIPLLSATHDGGEAFPMPSRDKVPVARDAG